MTTLYKYVVTLMVDTVSNAAVIASAMALIRLVASFTNASTKDRYTFRLIA